MIYNIYDIKENDIKEIKKVYKIGNENSGDDLENKFNKRVDKTYYNSFLFDYSENFWCDLHNKQLMDIVKKYVKYDIKQEYIADVHYVNYGIGQGAHEHTDTHSSIRTCVMILSNGFEGGNFYLDGKHIELKFGNMIEFDADLTHSVTPVENGNREVLVIFIKKSIKNINSLL